MIDNAVEAGAKKITIKLMEDVVDGGPVLRLTDDDGCGMNERELLDGPLSLAYTKKVGDHYGMGATTSIPVIAPYALILSAKPATCSSLGPTRTVGCISSSLSTHIGADQAKVPQCSWCLVNGRWEIIAESDAHHPLTLQAREASLELLTSLRLLGSRN